VRSLLPEVPAAVVSVEALTGVVSLEAAGEVVSLAGLTVVSGIFAGVVSLGIDFTGTVSRDVGFAGTVSLEGAFWVVSWEKVLPENKKKKQQKRKALYNKVDFVQGGVLFLFINSHCFKE
jgi:hypothetical protein